MGTLARELTQSVLDSLRLFPVVAIVGPRQVGKTTLAMAVRHRVEKPWLYLDLERDSDLNRLEEPELFLDRQRGTLVVIDEVQRMPRLLPLIRSLVDERIRNGEAAGHFLILGSASPELVRSSSESLAGRTAYHELSAFSLAEVTGYGTDGTDDMERLWERGGFPLSFLAPTTEASWEWRRNFMFTYIERDLPRLARRVPSETMRRFWTMLAFEHGNMLNAARLATRLRFDCDLIVRSPVESGSRYGRVQVDDRQQHGR